MHHYVKTELGLQTLQQRTLDLNARQRRLLLLIGTYDFQILSPILKQKIAAPELLKQLEGLGLIFSSQASNQQLLNSIPYRSDLTPKTDHQILTQENKPTIIPPICTTTETVPLPIITPTQPTLEAAAPEPLIYLNFEQVKQLMMAALTQYCGLMGKTLLIKIENSNNLMTLKQCQMQWLTLLQETRIPPIQLNRALQQINLSLQQMQSA